MLATSPNDTAPSYQTNSDAYIQAHLNDPKTLSALGDLLNKLPEINAMLNITMGLMQRGPEMADNINASVQEFRDMSGGMNIDIKGLMESAGKFQTLLQSEEVQALLESDILKPQTVSIVNKAADAMIESIEVYDPNQKMGIFGLMRTMNDPDVQRALSFATNFLKLFGQQLGK